MYLYLKQKVFSIGDKLTFFDVNQKPVYFVKGSILKIPHRLTISDAAGKEIVMVKTKMFRLLKEYNIINCASNEIIGRIKRRFSIGKKFNIEINGQKLSVDGSIFGFQFDIKNGAGESLVSVHKKYISWGDSYEIYMDDKKIKPEAVCAICVAFDNAVHPHR